MVRARTDRTDDFLGLGGREDELDMLWRLFDDLQQCVETLWRDHVRLVEDEDLVTVTRRREHRSLTQISCVVDAVMTRCVDLDYVEGTSAITAQFDTTGAYAARSVSRTLCAVEAASKDSCACCLAAPARPAEQIRVVDAVGAERGSKGIRDL